MELIAMPSPIIEVYRARFSPDQDAVLQAILRVQDVAYPSSWHFDDEIDYFRDALTNPDAVNLLVWVNGTVVGHLLAIPLSSALQDLVPHDPLIVSTDSGAYYIDSLASMPHQGYGTLRRLLRSLESELRNMDIRTLAMHARVITGLSRVLRTYYKTRIVTTRRIEHWAWYGGEEPTDYIEVILEENMDRKWTGI